MSNMIKAVNKAGKVIEITRYGLTMLDGFTELKPNEQELNETGLNAGLPGTSEPEPEVLEPEPEVLEPEPNVKPEPQLIPEKMDIESEPKKKRKR
jgi:hypothetical protein